MLNQATLVGRLTKDLTVRYTQDGKPVTNFILAVTRNYRDQDGNYKADFINCTLWGKIAEVTSDYCKKGSMIGIIGKILTRKYEDAEMKTIFVTEIVAEQVQFMHKQQQKIISDTDLEDEKERIIFGEEVMT